MGIYEIIKKTIISILISLLMVVSFGTKPISATTVTDTEDSFAIADRAGEIAVDIARAVEAFSGAGVEGAVEGVLKGLGGCNIAKGITSFLSLTMSILKLAGVFGTQPDPVMELRQHLDNRLDAIDGQLNDINSKLDSLQQSLNDGLKEIDSSLATISTTLYKENITAVASIADDIKQERKLFDVSLNDSLQDWYSFNDFQYDDNKLIIEYYSQKVENLEDEDEVIHTDTIVVNKSIIEEALNDHQPWDVNNKKTLIKNVFLKVAEAIKEQDDFKTYKNVAENTITTEELELTVDQMFADAAYDALVYECTHRIAKEKASELVKKFEKYCAYLTESEGNYTSPLNSQYEIYKKIYAFQGDLLCTYTYEENGQIRTINTNLANITRQKYICELNDIGAFVAEIAYTSKNYTDEDLKDTLYIPWATAEGKCNKIYSDFYKTATDSTGKTVDVNNYCYVTNCVLTYDVGKLTSSITADYRTYTNWYGKRNVGYLESNIENDWSFSVLNKDMINNIDLSKLYCYYENKTSDSFYDYLQKNNVFRGTRLTTYYPSEIITKFIGSNKFAEGDSVEMFVEACHQWDNGKYNDKSADNYDTTIVSAKDSDFVIRQKAVADTFNIDTGEAKYSNTIGAVAVYYKSNKHLDDIAMFWDAEYRTRMKNDAEKREALIDLRTIDSKTYYKESYEGEDTGRTYYQCHVDYSRPYAALFKVPIAGFTYANPTYAINKYSTNKGIENNPINIVDDDYKNKLPTDYKEDYDNEKSNLIQQFKEILKQFGYTDEQITRLELNDTYDLEFDRSTCSEITEDTYYFLFVNFASKLDFFVKEYRDLFSDAKKVVDITNNDLSVPLSENKLNKLIENIIKNDFGDSCKICDSIPETEVADYVYNKTNGKVYVWNENAYVDIGTNKSKATKDIIPERKTVVTLSSDTEPTDEYKGNIVYYDSKFYEWKKGKYEVYNITDTEEYIEKTTLPSSYEGEIIYCEDEHKFYKWNNSEEYVETASENFIYKNDINESDLIQLTDTSDFEYSYPTSNSKNIKVVYNVKPIIKFIFYLIDDDLTNIDYRTETYFDIKPQLIWTDNGEDKFIDISNDAIENTNIKIPIKIPILKLDYENHNTAEIYHLSNIKEKAFIDNFTCAINELNGVKYVTVYAKSFSPYVVNKTYYKSHEKNKYRVPATGIKYY